MRRAEKDGRFRRPIMIGWLSATVGYAVYFFGAQIELLLYVSGAAFFFGYSIYQPILPAFLTQQVPAAGRGTASGVYNFFGFIGSSLGGMLGGALIQYLAVASRILRRRYADRLVFLRLASSAGNIILDLPN